MSGEREAALRRIAIVLSSLPPSVAAQLLGELDANSKQLVRRTMTGLADVDPLERQRALQAFTGSVRQHQGAVMSDQDEISLTTVKRPGPDRATATAPDTDQPHSTRPGTPAHSATAHSAISSTARSNSAIDGTADVPQSLAALADMEDDVLVRAVSGEHPQTVALLLASVAPAQAARILPRLEPRLRSEAMSRIGRLSEIPSEMVEELAQHILSRIEPKTVSAPARGTADGRRRLDAILASMPQPLDTHPAAASPTAGSRHHAGSVTRTTSQQTPPPSAARSLEPVVPPQPLRIAPQTRHEGLPSERSLGDDNFDADHQSFDAPHESDGVIAEPATAHWSTDDIHNHLLRLSAVDLRDALAEVDTHDALMALCGLPIETTDAVIATLPKAAGREIRLQLASIGAMQLREIDVAKERVAIASLPASQRAQALSSLGQARVPLAA